MEYRLNDNMREALTILQYHIDKDSFNYLYIFRDKRLLEICAKDKSKDYFNDITFITEDDLFYNPNVLTGRRFRHYAFVSEEPNKKENEK